MSRVIAGPRAVIEALRSHPDSLRGVYMHGLDKASKDEIRRLASEQNIAVEERSRDDIARLADGLRHGGVIAVAREFNYASLDDLTRAVAPNYLLVALDEITDPHNLGAIIRSAVALGAHGIITMKDRAAQVTPVVVRTSAGATEHARIARVTNLSQTFRNLKKQGFRIIGLDAEGEQELSDILLPVEPTVLVVGSEGRGLRRLVAENCDHLAHIPLHGPVESLNASVAAGIALYACAKAGLGGRHG